jgi:hypothetical protein
MIKPVRIRITPITTKERKMLFTNEGKSVPLNPNNANSIEVRKRKTPVMNAFSAFLDNIFQTFLR